MVENTLVNRQDLAHFVDELIKKKSLPAMPAEELNDLRARTIDTLDDHIGLAIFGQLDDAEDDELNRMLDDDSATERDYDDFFTRAGINISQTVQDTMTAFATAFLEEGVAHA